MAHKVDRRGKRHVTLIKICTRAPCFVIVVVVAVAGGGGWWCFFKEKESRSTSLCKAAFYTGDKAVWMIMGKGNVKILGIHKISIHTLGIQRKMCGLCICYYLLICLEYLFYPFVVYFPSAFLPGSPLYVPHFKSSFKCHDLNRGFS